MNRQRQLELLETWYQEKIEVSGKKGNDYANEDMLDNFRRMAILCATLNVDVHTPEGVAIFYAIAKIDRFCNLYFSDKVPENESVDDTLMDGGIYFDLLRMIVTEMREYE